MSQCSSPSRDRSGAVEAQKRQTTNFLYPEVEHLSTLLKEGSGPGEVGETVHFYRGKSMSKSKEVLKSPHGPREIQCGKDAGSVGVRGEVGWDAWPRLLVKVRQQRMLTEQEGDIVSFTLW